MSLDSTDWFSFGKDIFGDAQSGGAGPGSIGAVNEDYTNVQDIFNGNATSADWGAATGAGIGGLFGAPQAGADIGRTLLPALQDLFK